MALSEQARSTLDPAAAEIIGRYPRPRSALLPLLHLVQAEEGYVSKDGIAYCAEQLSVSEAEVTAVVSFYTMYKRQPVGDYHVGVCTNALCAVMGGDAIFADLQSHLGIGNEETTGDGKITLEHLECNAACDYAPVMMVNWEFFDDMTPQAARDLVDALRSGAPAVADPRRAAAVHLAAGVEDPGRLPRRPGGRRAHRRATRPWRACGSPRSTAGRPTQVQRRQRQGAAQTRGRQRRGQARDTRADPGAHRPLGRGRLVHAGGLPAATADTRRCPRRWRCSRTRSSRRSRTRCCAAAAGRASRPASSGASSRRATASRTTWWSTPTSQSRAPARTCPPCWPTRRR